MRVYRIQDANNLGPMHYKSTIRGNVKYHNDPDSHQAFKNGAPVKVQFIGTDVRFAWDSLQNLYGFIRFPGAVDDAGYRVVVYDVPDAECITWQDGQVAFWMDAAVKVEEFLYSEVGKKMFASRKER